MKVLLFPAILLICLFFSCKKQYVACTGNCYSLNVDGKVVNMVTNTNAPNVPLIIYQVKSQGIFSFSNIVQEFNSRSDGTFSTAPSIDSTMFQNGYFLSLDLKENNDYMTIPRNNNRLDNLARNSFKNVNILVYPKVNMTIKLNRNQNDNFQYFSVSYYFVDNGYFFPYTILTPLDKDIHKTQLIVPTSSDIYTKIMVTKRDYRGVSTATLDSIKCVKNGANTYTVNF